MQTMSEGEIVSWVKRVTLKWQSQFFSQNGREECSEYTLYHMKERLIICSALMKEAAKHQTPKKVFLTRLKEDLWLLWKQKDNCRIHPPLIWADSVKSNLISRDHYQLPERDCKRKDRGVIKTNTTAHWGGTSRQSPSRLIRPSPVLMTSSICGDA